MFTAMLLVCNSTFTDCQVYSYPAVLPDKELCMAALGGGIEFIESKGLYVKDYACYQWPESS